jgi:hypothetical protein
MDDRDVENLLRQCRPVGPPAELRRRILASARSERRVWPWMAAAAALCFATIGLHVATNRLSERTSRVASSAALRAEHVDALDAIVGDDPYLLRQAALLGALEERDAPSAPTESAWR